LQYRTEKRTNLMAEWRQAVLLEDGCGGKCSRVQRPQSVHRGLTKSERCARIDSRNTTITLVRICDDMCELLRISAQTSTSLGFLPWFSRWCDDATVHSLFFKKELENVHRLA
jgi:hypothetical protein